MAASLSFSNLYSHGLATVSVSGDTANAVRTLEITHPSGVVETYSIKMNGSGAASQTFCVQSENSNSYTATLLSVPATIATASSTSKHQS